MLEEESATKGKGRAGAGGRGKGEDVKRGWVGWGRGGTSFVVWDMNGFTTSGL
jgi:osomolarity two-component system response regulator SKN7